MPERPRRKREEQHDRKWRNQSAKFRGDGEFRKHRDDDRWERDRRGVRRERPKNALEEKYHKPYNERMREERGLEEERSRFSSTEAKVKKNVKFRKPRLFDESEFAEKEVVMRSRKKDLNKE